MELKEYKNENLTEAELHMWKNGFVKKNINIFLNMK